MFNDAVLRPILAPYGLKAEKAKIVSCEQEFGSVGIDAVYELMFLHDMSRHSALTEIAKLLNEPVFEPHVPSKPKKRKPKKRPEGVKFGEDHLRKLWGYVRLQQRK